MRLAPPDDYSKDTRIILRYRTATPSFDRRMKLPRFDRAQEHAAQNIGAIVEQPGRLHRAIWCDDHLDPGEIVEIDRGRQRLGAIAAEH